MKFRIDLNEDEIRKAVKAHVESFYDMKLTDDVKLTVEVKSKQNFKSEWETASYRAYLEK